VLRVRVKREKGEWTVVKKIRVPEMTIPASDKLPRPGPSGRLSGLWFEAMDTKGEVVYRRILHAPQQAVEIFEDDGSMTRVKAGTDEYSVDLLIPHLPGISEVRLFHERPEREEVMKKAVVADRLQPIAVFDVRDADSKQEEGR